MRRWLTAVAAALGVACASAAPPPGGAEDRQPPKLVRVTPDTNAVNVTDRVAAFQFDETINDRGSGAQELSNFFIVSPTDGNVRISYHRSRIDVRPRLGFRPNTAYTITVLPGLADLRGNVSRTGASVVFSTGPTIPAHRLTGIVFDWATERPAVRALVQAVTPDSVTYLAYTDSTGRYTIGPLPAGSYLVRAVIDANNNRAPDRNEALDSARVTAPQAAPSELLAIVRDTLAPRLTPSVVVVDSTGLRITFDRPLAPSAIPGPDAFRLVGPDSVAIAITAVLTPKQEADAAQAAVDARIDSTRRADSLSGKPKPAAPVSAVPVPSKAAMVTAPAKPGSPAPPSSLLLRLARRLAPGTSYRLNVTNARALSGRESSSERIFTTPRPPAAVAPRTRADSAAVAPTPPRPE